MESTTLAKPKTVRVLFFDEMRGVMILNMVLYHLLYDLVVLFDVKIGWYFTPATDLWQISICGTFIIISGACCCHSRSNLKRGLRLLLLACAFSLVTWIAMPSMLILFGLLHFLAVSVLLFPLMKKVINKVQPVAGIVGCLILFLITYNVSDGWLGFSQKLSFALPEWLYLTNWLFPLGFYAPNFFSSDYFPLIPYLFLFLAGAFLGNINMPDWMYKSHSKVLAILGKRSLWIYLLHQPILYGILWLIF